VLLDGLRHNRGPTGLSTCRITCLSTCQIDPRALANALRTNRSVKTLVLGSYISSESLRFVLRALEENKGLERLQVTGMG